MHALDSLIQNANNFALNKADYQEAFQKAVNAGDQADSLLQKVANHFFNDLAYGNRIPKLQYEGAKFNMSAYDIPTLVNTYAVQNNLAALPNYIIGQSKEVATILDSLHYYSDPLHLNKDKVALLENCLLYTSDAADE